MLPITLVSLPGYMYTSATKGTSNMIVAEEIQNAATVIPVSMGISTLLNGTLGFGMLIALLFCIPSDITDVLNTDTLYPFMDIYAYAVGSNTGATAMVCTCRSELCLSLSIVSEFWNAHTPHH